MLHYRTKIQESLKAYGTAVSRLVIHLNKIILNHSQIWGASEHDPNPNYNPNSTLNLTLTLTLALTNPNLNPNPNQS